METLTLDLPTMYGDHHVLEVRQKLLALPGVDDVYASSAFHAVEVSFDPAQVGEEAIKAKLEEAGYLGEIMVVAETGLPVDAPGGSVGTYYRHSSAYQVTNNTMNFEQQVPYNGRPLWPCPGMGPLEMKEGE